MKVITAPKRTLQNDNYISPIAQQFYHRGTEKCRNHEDISPTFLNCSFPPPVVVNPESLEWNNDSKSSISQATLLLDGHHHQNGYGTCKGQLINGDITTIDCKTSNASVKRLWGMITLCLVDFSAATCFSIIEPFFPAEAETKGVGHFWTGAIFGTLQGIQFLVSPFFGLYMYDIGVKRLYLTGIGVNALAIFAFSFTVYIKSRTIFISLTLILRTFQGLGCAAYLTSSYLFTANIYPDNVGLVFGILETCAGLGFAIGPALGGVLYLYGGYVAPFLTVSVSLMVLLVAAIYLLPTLKDMRVCQKKILDEQQYQRYSKKMFLPTTHDEKSPLIDHQNKPLLLNVAGDDLYKECNLPLSPKFLPIPFQNGVLHTGNGHMGNDVGRTPKGVRRELKKALKFLDLLGFEPPTVALDCLVLIAGALSVGFVDPTLEPFLRSRRLGLTSAGVGAIFLALSATYTLSALVLGRLMDCPTLAGPKLRRTLLLASLPLTIIGLLLTSAGFNNRAPIIGPLATERARVLTAVCASQIAIGAAFGAQVVVSFTDIMDMAVSNNQRSVYGSGGISQGCEAHALVSGLYTSALALGSFLGPLIGGSLTLSLAYEPSAAIVAAIGFVVFVICTAATAYQMGRGTFFPMR